MIPDFVGWEQKRAGKKDYPSCLVLQMSELQSRAWGLRSAGSHISGSRANDGDSPCGLTSSKHGSLKVISANQQTMEGESGPMLR